MGLSASLSQRQSQSLVMTPQLMQSIQLLQMPYAELLAFIGTEVEKNPLLEIATSDAEENEAASQDDGRDASGETLLTEAGDLNGDWYDNGENGRLSSLEQGLDTNFAATYDGDEVALRPASADLSESWVSQGSSTPSDGFEPDDFSAAQITLHDHVAAQLPFAFVQDRERKIAEAMTALLEDTGYIDAEAIRELESRLGLREGEADRLLERLQALDPPGIFARTLSECLSIQLKQKNQLDPMMARLLDHLDLLGKRDFQALKRICHASEEDLLAMLADIRKLNPKPGSGFGGGLAESVLSDVIVRPGSDGHWLVDLNPAAMPRVLINQTYHRTVSAKGARASEDQAFLSNCLQSANWLVRSLDQRARTILKVAEEIVRQQDAFLLHGVDHLRPLTLKAVADAVGVHESTVSRVTSNKFMETPRGVFELKYFFTVSIAGVEDGDSHSAEAVRNRIRTMIAEESPSAILSDDDIVDMLAKGGVQLARRTVAKYREAMNISSSVQRRREKQAEARLASGRSG